MNGGAVLDALADSALGSELLTVFDARSGIHVVGGYVRDTLLGRPPRELDVVVEGDSLGLARELATRLGAAMIEHGRFGTATLTGATQRLDLATTRQESYPAPGALPVVRLGVPLELDLRRRDFTVNGLAVGLGGVQRGTLSAVPGGLDDLGARRLRVLHQDSFSDDPTRLLRLARYAQRLGFEIDAGTAELARGALSAGALATVSGTRLGAELRLALAESDPVANLSALQALGVLAAIDDHLRCDPDLARRALLLLPGDGSPGLLALAACATGFPDRASLLARLDALAFSGRERDLIAEAALDGAGLAAGLATATRPSELQAAAAGRSVEAVALAGALGAEAGAARWLGELRHVTLVITGEDLLAAGVPAGPEVGRRLALALAARLNGELPAGAQAELEAALAG